MKITKRQLRQIIRESLQEQAGPTNPPSSGSPAQPSNAPIDIKSAISAGRSRGGRPDGVVKDIKAWQSEGIAEDLIAAYMSGYHMAQSEMDMWYDDVPGYYPGKVANDIASEYGITIPKMGDII